MPASLRAYRIAATLRPIVEARAPPLACKSAPRWDPDENLSYRRDKVSIFAPCMGSPSAPIGTPSPGIILS